MAISPSTVAPAHQIAMDEFNDLAYFASVVEHHGFSAAARATGVEKTRLSRRVAALERRLGVRLLQRSTRSLALTEAGRRFYAQCVVAVAGARAAYESIADLRHEPAGTVRMSCAPVMAQSYLAPILPGFLAQHPKVDLILDATDREVNLIEERIDLALRAKVEIEETPGLVARPLGSGRHILVASPTYLARIDQPTEPLALSDCDTLVRPIELFDGKGRWVLNGPGAQSVTVPLVPRLVANDMRLLLEATVHGVGISLLPEAVVAGAIRSGLLTQVLADWTTPTNRIVLLYPSPKGMLPSVRSLIDYLLTHMPASLQERSVDMEAIQRASFNLNPAVGER